MTLASGLIGFPAQPPEYYRQNRTDGTRCEPRLRFLQAEAEAQVVIDGGTIVLGPCNLPASVGQTTSQLYATNLLNFVQELVEEGALKLDLEDEIQKGSLVCHGGEVVHDRVKEAL